MGLFGQDKNSDPKEQVREWNRKMRQEMRQLDRQVASIQREELKVKRQIKEAAKKGDKDVCRVLAKGIVQSRKAVTKLYTSKAQINSVCMGMQQQLATMRMAGSIQRSTEVMKSMQSLVRVPEIAATMRELSREMMKAGIIDEMIEETLESVEPEELEEEAQAEVDKILWEVTAGELGRAPAAPAGAVSVAGTVSVGPSSEYAEAIGGRESPEEDLSAMRDRLEALRS